MSTAASLRTALLCAGLAGAAHAAPLPALNIDRASVTVSGLSSGGYMATQLQVAWSSVFKGAGVIAAGPYYCAQGLATLAMTRCLTRDSAPPVAALVATAKAWAGKHYAVYGLARSGLATVRALWEMAGSTVLDMDPYLHDKILGAVSHLPHVAAFALMSTLADVRDHGIPELDLAGHSGGGLRDTTRIAASSTEMWRYIFLWNRDNIVSFIEAYERRLGELKRLIHAGDGAGLEEQAHQHQDPAGGYGRSWSVG